MVHIGIFHVMELGSDLSDGEVSCEAGLLALLAHDADAHAGRLYHRHVVPSISYTTNNSSLLDP